MNYLHSRKRRLRIRLSLDFDPNVVRAYVPHLQWDFVLKYERFYIHVYMYKLTFKVTQSYK